MGLLLLAMLGTGDALAGWRCDGRIIEEGASDYQVRSLCGEPDYVDARPQVFVAGLGLVGSVAEWYYNGGTQRLTRVLHFRNGELRRIETAGHGISPVLAGHCQPNDIRRGMSKFELALRCGEPDDRRSSYTSGGYDRYRTHVRLRQIDRWIYLFGSRRFSRIVRLENGRVTDVSTGERGGW